MCEVLGFFCRQYSCCDGDCTVVLIPIFPVYIRYVFYFCFLFVVFALFGCFWLAGQVVCDWVSILVSRVFSGGFTVFWVCLGFLLPLCTFCGLSILLWGRVKVVGSDCCV